jgi:hypothetical protein
MISQSDACNANLTTEQECGLRCNNVTGCRYFVYKSKAAGGTCAGGCWLKTARGMLYYDEAYTTG